MKVIITEKPSVARDIAKVLKISTKKDGYFEGSGYQISWAFGHLVRLSDPDTYDKKYEKWDMSTLPIIPSEFKLELQKDNGAKQQFKTIETLLSNKDVEEVICATDAGREGELIFRHIYTLANCDKPIKRLWISSQTDKAIKEGFAKLKDGVNYDGLYDSALSRSEADWLIGMNATRAYTIRFSFGKGVMSVGRVQTPVLNMIVERYLENINFKPETYYEIETTVKHENGKFKALWLKDKESRLVNEEDALKIVNDIKANPKGLIDSTQVKGFQEKPPLLYDLTELQKDANKKFRFSADKTLKLMQSLYETHKILTYPRTSSRYLSTDLKPKIKGLLEQLFNLPELGEFARQVSENPLEETNRIFDDKKVTDHHAIIPTDKKPDINALSIDEAKIYDMVIKRFLSAQMANCEKEQTEIISKFADHTFRTSGIVIKKIGWRTVYNSDELSEKKGKKDQAEESLLPIVLKGDSVDSKDIKSLKKQTKAPPIHNEASILASMETAGKYIEDEELRQAMKDCGLGTPATRAQILERLVQVKYIEREKNKLIPTEKGQYLIKCIQNKELLSPELTGEWEKKLNLMAQNEWERTNYMEDIKEFTKTITEGVSSSEVNTPAFDKKVIGKCPLCEGDVVESKMAFGCNNWKTKSCKFTIWKLIAKKEISEDIAKELLENGKTEKLKGFKSKAGKDFETTLVLKDGKVEFDFS